MKRLFRLAIMVLLFAVPVFGQAGSQQANGKPECADGSLKTYIHSFETTSRTLPGAPLARVTPGSVSKPEVKIVPRAGMLILQSTRGNKIFLETYGIDAGKGAPVTLQEHAPQGLVRMVTKVPYRYYRLKDSCKVDAAREIILTVQSDMRENTIVHFVK